MRTAETIEKCFLSTGKVHFEGPDGVYVESVGYILIDLQTSPYSTPEEIQKELDEIMQLSQTPEVLEAIEQLERNLKYANDQRN